MDVQSRFRSHCALLFASGSGSFYRNCSRRFLDHSFCLGLEFNVCCNRSVQTTIPLSCRVRTRDWAEDSRLVSEVCSLDANLGIALSIRVFLWVVVFRKKPISQCLLVVILHRSFTSSQRVGSLFIFLLGKPLFFLIGNPHSKNQTQILSVMMKLIKVVGGKHVVIGFAWPGKSVWGEYPYEMIEYLEALAHNNVQRSPLLPIGPSCPQRPEDLAF